MALKVPAKLATSNAAFACAFISVLRAVEGGTSQACSPSKASMTRINTVNTDENLFLVWHIRGQGAVGYS